MSHHQENFDRAREAAANTLGTLNGTDLDLSNQPKHTLQKWLWDLEAVAATIRLELMSRETHQPMDLG